ncbi:Shikimate kinase [Mycovorax composti]|uniref:Shikimate kinase n=2 Tax=Chitinophagaceae TaxID=563835 RepID=A0ABZ2ENM0_9BACT
MRIYLIGFMGAGKTYWGRQLGQKLGIPFFDLDELIEDDAGKSVNSIFEEEGEEYFRTREKEILYMVTESHDSMVLSCGGGAPCFFNNIDYMNQKGITVWLNTPIDTLLSRLKEEKHTRPLLKGLDDEALRAYIIKKSADRRIYYERAKIKIDDDNLDLDNFIKLIFNE